MKTTSLILLTVFAIIFFSCRKKKSEGPKASFVKSIRCTYPVTDTSRSSDFTYDERNRIKQYDFRWTSSHTKATFLYNEDDMITEIDRTRTDLSTGNVTETRYRFRYAARILNEYILDGTSEPVTHLPADNSYTLTSGFLTTFYLDANSNLKRMYRNGRTVLQILHSGGNGVFSGVQAQVASYIYAQSMFLASQSDIYAFSQNVITEVEENGTPLSYTSVRDDNGNIVQTDVKNASGTLVKRFGYTYELREIR
ncbi:MAG: hypothetical protein EOP49_10475 [Sphingobacteriales bacterium]|nr:MAG: hypothetical protein EOP49_10475 [Sphingobacteriales bacterium]